MRELLIRYLLGELEPHEHDAVQQQLAESPELREQLAHLRSCFASSLHADEDDRDELPRGLAERTAVHVAESDSYDALPKRTSPASQGADPPSSVLGWNLADLVVAGGVVLAVSMLLFPAIRQSRDGTRLNYCQNNLRQLGQITELYIERNHGYLPLVQPDENAGIFTTEFVEGDYISPHDLKLLLVCPDAPLANAIHAKQFELIIPTRAELDAMPQDRLTEVRAHMSPTYAYCMGYRVANQYHYIRRGFRTPVLCDAPADDGSGMSSNHSQLVLQVLLADGSVAVLTTGKARDGQDDLFWNMNREVAAGWGPDDSVLGSTTSTPGVVFTADNPQLRGKPSRMQVLPAVQKIGQPDGAAK